MEDPSTGHADAAKGRYKEDINLFMGGNSKEIEGGQYLCLICSKVTSHSGNMSQHFTNHHWSGTAPGQQDSPLQGLPCQYCGRKFKNNNSLGSHVSQNHKQQRQAEKARINPGQQVPGNHYLSHQSTGGNGFKFDNSPNSNMGFKFDNSPSSSSGFKFENSQISSCSPHGTDHSVDPTNQSSISVRETMENNKRSGSKVMLPIMKLPINVKTCRTSSQGSKGKTGGDVEVGENVKIQDGDKEITVNCEVDKLRCMLCKLTYKTKEALQYHNIMTHPELTSSPLPSSEVPNNLGIIRSRDNKMMAKSKIRPVPVDVVKVNPKSETSGQVIFEESSPFTKLQSLPWLNLSVNPLEEITNVGTKTPNKLLNGFHANVNMENCDQNTKSKSHLLFEGSGEINYKIIKNVLENNNLTITNMTVSEMQFLTSSTQQQNKTEVKMINSSCTQSCLSIANTGDKNQNQFSSDNQDLHSRLNCLPRTLVIVKDAITVAHETKITNTVNNKTEVGNDKKVCEVETGNIIGKPKKVKAKWIIQKDLSDKPNIIVSQKFVKDSCIIESKPARKCSRLRKPKIPVKRNKTDLVPSRRKSERIFNGDKLFGCNHCQLAFSSNEAKVEHERTHQEKPFECPYCEMRFLAEISVNRHIRIHKDIVKECD